MLGAASSVRTDQVLETAPHIEPATILSPGEKCQSKKGVVEILSFFF
jgi:hypothetical protein